MGGVQGWRAGILACHGLGSRRVRCRDRVTGVNRIAVVAIRIHCVELGPRMIVWTHVNHDASDVRNVMHQLMLDRRSNYVSLADT